MSNNPIWILWTFSYGMASSFVRLDRPAVNSKDRERVSLMPVPPRAYHHVCHIRQAQRMFAGCVDGFCRHLMIYTVLRHPSSYYLIFQKALAHKGKLISLSLFNWWWYAGHTKQSCYNFLSFKNYNGLILPPGAEPSWIPHTALGPGTQVCLKAKIDPVLLSFTSYKIHQILKNSVIIRPKRKKKKKAGGGGSWSWIIQPGIIVTFLFFPFLTSFWSPLSIVWNIHLPPQKESTSYRIELTGLWEACSLC